MDTHKLLMEASSRSDTKKQIKIALYILLPHTRRLGRARMKSPMQRRRHVCAGTSECTWDQRGSAKCRLDSPHSATLMQEVERTAGPTTVPQRTILGCVRELVCETLTMQANEEETVT